MIEAVGRDIAEPIQPGVDLAAAGLEEWVEQIWPLQIVIDENNPFWRRECMEQA